jgi:hypothetical protein
MMNTSLYVLANEYQAQLGKLLELDIDEQTMKDTVEGLSGELEVKATNVAMFIRNLEASAEQIKLAEKAMSDRRKAIENKADSIKRYLFENMKRTEITKIESPHFTLSIKKNPPSVVIEDESLIPNEYVEDKVVTSINKAAIKDAINAGKEVTGAHIQQGERLEIK